MTEGMCEILLSTTLMRMEAFDGLEEGRYNAAVCSMTVCRARLYEAGKRSISGDRDEHQAEPIEERPTGSWPQAAGLAPPNSSDDYSKSSDR